MELKEFETNFRAIDRKQQKHQEFDIDIICLKFL